MILCACTTWLMEYGNLGLPEDGLRHGERNEGQIKDGEAEWRQ